MNRRCLSGTALKPEAPAKEFSGLRWRVRLQIAQDIPRFYLALVLLTAAGLLTGCGGDGTPPTYTVKGKVVYKATQQPVTQGTVLFESASTPKVQASGEIQPDGTFELASDLGKPGTVAGEHRVLIQPPILEVGQKPIVQKRYTSYSTSKLTATVHANNSNNITLEVE